MASKKKASKRAKKPAAKGAASRKSGARAARKVGRRRPGDDEVVYSDVRREMRSRLIGRLLGP